ncbi:MULTISPECIES: hypothetical protein [Chryseobacterium]|uniref:Uncharacterized protein n=1 Tax=Chryseobacterium taihuense TaxID=1141221 RepID=A0A1G9JVH8_9FLAO|nr:MULTISPECIES: hypothetical protein [Chryseobacterium]QQV01182.1 hypothetical protein I6I61_08665 [Chryseobacterium sp. FDAARGOS 1104]SDL40843.1 hypothetical protein SAMN05216273_10136 [Chryseobacterium taihuense]VFB02230.1 Uncharacterised protein [Chryseobacterium taihuense]
MKNKNKYRKGWWFCIILCPPVIFLLISWIVMLLWNGLLPEILGVKAISFWQAMGILILSKILFGGFHGKFGQGMRQMKEKHLQHKMEGMTPEEKEKFKEIWRQKCSGGFFNKNNE